MHSKPVRFSILNLLGFDLAQEERSRFSLTSDTLYQPQKLAKNQVGKLFLLKTLISHIHISRKL